MRHWLAVLWLLLLTHFQPPAQAVEPRELTDPKANTLAARWTIAENYHLYRDKPTLSLPTLPSLNVDTGQPAEIASADPAVSSDSEQGVVVHFRSEHRSEQDLIAHLLLGHRFWAIPAFFSFGLMLAFTPCVFPMIPILSSLIVGQGEGITRRQAFLLSLAYVLAMATTYTVAGMLAARLGQNVQALFQNPWVLIAFSGVFVGLALSLFGLYDLQLPGRWQARLAELCNRQRSGSYVGAAVMGLLSALIVGPCVAPPLVGVLTVITTTGDMLLGGVALFVLSLGMGAPLLLVGASAGHFLPRAGQWMERIKAVFGMLLLAVAIWMLERVLPDALGMLLWAVLLILSALYMGALRSLGRDAPAWRTLVKGLGIVLLAYGILLLVGMAAGGRDPLQPLRGVGFAPVGPVSPGAVSIGLLVVGRCHALLSGHSQRGREDKYARRSRFLAAAYHGCHCCSQRNVSAACHPGAGPLIRLAPGLVDLVRPQRLGSVAKKLLFQNLKFQIKHLKLANNSFGTLPTIYTGITSFGRG